MTQPPLGVNQSVVELKKNAGLGRRRTGRSSRKEEGEIGFWGKAKKTGTRKKWPCLHFQTARINTLSDHR
jgi:transposase-like protein